MPIGLIHRNELTDEEEVLFALTSKLPPRLIGHISGRTNPEPSGVAQHLKQIGLPYSSLYVPFFVYAGMPPEVLNDANTGVWGRSFEMNLESVLPDLQLVCRADIQTAALQGQPKGWFTDLRGLSVKQKEQALHDAARKSPTYAETRMFRPLREEDFL